MSPPSGNKVILKSKTSSDKNVTVQVDNSGKQNDERKKRNVMEVPKRQNVGADGKSVEEFR